MKKRIFALDNEQPMLDLITAIVHGDDVEVVTCNKPTDAIKMILEDKQGFDLIVSDIHMPNMTGFDFVDELRGHKDFYYIPILFLTAMEDDQLRIDAYKRNVFDFLVKPLNTKTFKYKILSILENYDELRKSVFTIKKGPFDSKQFREITKEAEKNKWNGYLVIDNRRQGRCIINLLSGYMDGITLRNNKGDIIRDDKALDKVLKWRSGQYIVYHNEISKYFDI